MRPIAKLDNKPEVIAQTILKAKNNNKNNYDYNHNRRQQALDEKHRR